MIIGNDIAVCGINNTGASTRGRIFLSIGGFYLRHVDDNDRLDTLTSD